MPKHLVLLALLVLALSSPARAADFAEGLRAYDAGDYPAAVAAWQPLAQTGDPEAQAALAGMYAQGMGVARDPATAARWYRAAAGQGHVVAQFNLGELYALGRGVPRDPVRAYAWFELAAQAGSRWAAAQREALAAELTAEQVAAARRLARGKVSR